MRRNTHEKMDNEYSLVLVGCKYDLWLAGKGDPVTLEQCREMARHISARSLVLTSAKTRYGLCKETPDIISTAGRPSSLQWSILQPCLELSAYAYPLRRSPSSVSSEFDHDTVHVVQQALETSAVLDHDTWVTRLREHKLAQEMVQALVGDVRAIRAANKLAAAWRSRKARRAQL